VVGHVRAEGVVGLLRIHPRVREFLVHRLQDAGKRPEEVLVPVQLHDFVETVTLLDLCDAAGVGRPELGQRRHDEAAPVAHERPLYGSFMHGTRAVTRIGGHVVAETLRSLGAEVVFGLPGVHALPIWEGLEASGLRVLGFRQEANAAFAADGYARVTGRPAPVVVSTGPGAFMTLGPLTEAFTAFVPVVVVSSQIKSAAIGKGRGELHETPDQAASFAPLVKWTGRAATTDDIPAVLAEGWRRAATPPQGPVYVEVPYDVLRASASERTEERLEAEPEPVPLPDGARLDRAAAVLSAAARPLVVAGGGVARSRARAELQELAERLDAVVATTYTGKGAFPERHPLALGSSWDDAPFVGALGDADVVLVVGSWLGYEFADRFEGVSGTVIQIDAARERIGIAHPALGLVGDAKATLQALLERIEPRETRDGTTRAASVRDAVERSLAEQPSRLEVELLETIESTLPEGSAAAWDSTILAYTACWYLRVAEPRRFLYPAGSSTLGYAFPAALGAAAALPGSPTLAVVGDGGFQYGIAELATAKQHGLDVTLLVIDDGGYGILREYQDEAGFANTGVDLEHVDLIALSEAFGVPARASSPERLADDLGSAFSLPGPAVLVLESVLTMPSPSAIS
jgi:acetolactate synthase-1/2/3 large subunit